MATACATLLRTTSWAHTPLGPRERWSQSLNSFAAMVVEMPTPAILFWGPDLVQIYNDGYGVIMGPRHPGYFGATYRECWPDTYPVIHPWMQRVLAGEVIRVERQLFVLTRYGFTEEAYFTFTFSPLRDDSGRVAGVFQPVIEVTLDVLAERRAETLRQIMPSVPLGEGISQRLEVLGNNPQDVAFAVFYAPLPGGELAAQAGVGITLETLPVPALLDAAWRERRAVVCPVAEVVGDRPHVGAWGEPTRDVFVCPVPRASGGPPHGVLAFGLSPRLRFDERYRQFLEAVQRNLSAALDSEVSERAEREMVERLEAARADAEAERRRLHSVFMQAPVAITVTTGADDTIELANPEVLRLWGRSAEEVHGRPMFEAMPDLVGQGLEQLLEGVRATGEPYVGTELPIQIRRADDGALVEHFFNFVYEPLFDAAGQVSAIVAVASDVTTLVLARHAAESLAEDLDAARQEAEEARDASLRANRAKDEFLAMLGHELRNPLAPIFTALELLRLRPSGASIERECAVIDRQARHLAALVEDLLDVSRITSGKIDLQRQRIDVAEAIAKAIETASPLLEKHRHELRLDVDAGLVVDGDSERLTQVFANLLTNAAKYTDPGGRITIEGHREGAEVVIAVRDTGRGIAPDMLARVFDLFAQEPQNLDRALGGLGLGLAIVKSLVAMHKGRIDARSEGHGMGSTFIVRLPLAAAAMTRDVGDPERDTQKQRALGTLNAHQILIVDDNEDAAHLLDETLAALGYSCTVAHDGPQALELARQHRYDAVLLDIGLPAMDGYEVARHLRQLPGWNDVELVAITGYGTRGDRERSAQAGFDHHLVKPVDIVALTRLLQADLE